MGVAGVRQSVYREVGSKLPNNGTIVFNVAVAIAVTTVPRRGFHGHKTLIPWMTIDEEVCAQCGIAVPSSIATVRCKVDWIVVVAKLLLALFGDPF